MLKKENRLTAEKDFGRVFKGSRPIHTENLVFRVAKTNHKSQITNHKQAPDSKKQTEILKPSFTIAAADRQVQDDRQTMKQSSNETMVASRFGFVISNKISKLATRRNALKRQLRAIIEQELPNIKAGYDVVIMVKLDFGYPYKQEEIREQVDKGLTKAGLL